MEQDNSPPYQELERMAREAEPYVLSQRGRLFAEAQEEYERDVQGFRFRCNIWGDWLELSIARLANRKGSSRVSHPQSHSAAVNLKQIQVIEYYKGRLPDTSGEVGYEYGQTSKDCKHYTWKVEPRLPEIPNSRPLFRSSDTTKLSGPRYGLWGQLSLLQFTTPNFVSPASDDVIRFHGIDAEIYVPANMGEKAYKEILAAKDQLS